MTPALFCKRVIWIPTWKGWILLMGTVFLCALLFLKAAYPILAPTQRQAANILVVEGWLPEYALTAAINEYHTHGYQFLITSGGPLWEGHHASGFHSYAGLAAQVIRAQTFDTNHLVVAHGPKVWRHRTYHSALAVRECLQSLDGDITGINVMTLGPHGRRTKIIFENVLRDLAPVGIISFPSAEYDARRWWRTSEGTKHLLTEALASTYEWLFESGRPTDRPSNKPVYRP